ncbi:MAG: N-acetylmuramic acid 6-phosphate etherase [Paraglaciecola chathamensis]|jgi:N-acetylmuramic acid 6-phosphate etherase|uniref:N-acetylmuramic acid 6-phosphate etherase n=2 Tax=Paraglaciecola chathamensis TaxID=368405 RepID=A0A8H9M4I1_9ALTE|nr:MULTISPECIES: N-acetylmuramic acid 6-phosphate etherase [Paraglaciecola]AEE24971.1 glucokinase regulatory-like protein [Glaciecola sp. 4H-3-7+YE-5]GAC05013.1 N-acetylmuramic acid 6-phosphate etherase [Paraglaciecola agarilytica NO2]GGZ70089.1 N-acetylmuramic acid 6-phosphate etherase 1 [Paraglaciecola oceanifecundans]
MTQLNLLSELNRIASEGRNLDTLDIDTLPTLAILEKINQEDHKVAGAVNDALSDIALGVDAIVSSFNRGGRLIYMGAGTSGRLGILDAVECMPTFSVPEGMVIGLIAGGENAVIHAVEGAEDDRDKGVTDLKALNFSHKDVLVGIAASGRTPYVAAGLEYAKQCNAQTIALSCNPNSVIGQIADIDICAQVGPEVLTGSTRLKSGTAQKLVLNMLSTASMIRIGKTYQNLMVDVKASNQKLHARAVRIVMQATDCDEQTAYDALDQANNEVKVAILMLLTQVNAQQARETLAKEKGFLRNAVSQEPL